jgi:ubiquinone/menaquinone biosynthesis C-methylase UbiE
MPYPNVTKVMDVHDLKFADNSFDKIVCWEVLEHLRSPIQGLGEMKRVLKDDGEMEISVPNVWYWRLLLRAWLGFHFKRYRGLAHESETDHKQMWDIYTFEGLCKQVGLAIKEIKWLDWYGEQKNRKLSIFEPLIRLFLPKHIKYTHVMFTLRKLGESTGSTI